MALGGRVPTLADIEGWTSSLLRKQERAATGYRPAVQAFNNFKALFARRFAQYSFGTPNVTTQQRQVGWDFVNRVLSGASSIYIPAEPANAGAVYETGGPAPSEGPTSTQTPGPVKAGLVAALLWAAFGGR